MIYRQHNSPDRFQEYFNEIIERFSFTGNPIYIMGDINLDLLKCQTSSFSHDFLLSLQSCYLIPTIEKPTRIHRTSATLIDNIFVNNPDQVYASGYVITDVSDHFSQFCFITSELEKNSQSLYKKHDFSRLSIDAFNRELSEIDWRKMLATKAHDVDLLFSSFYKNINKIIKKHAPIIYKNGL